MSLKWIVDIYVKLSGAERVIFLILIASFSFLGLNKKFGSNPVSIQLKIWNIKTKDTLYEQMNTVEAAHASIMFCLKKAYSDLNKDENDNQHYELITVKAEKECKAMIRKWLKENHFTSRTETEFDFYVKEKIDLLLDLVTYTFDLKYKDEFFKVSREILFNKNSLDVIPTAKEKWRKMFYDCRSISSKNEKRIEKLEGKRNGFFK